MAVKHIEGADGNALCGISVRSGSDRWNDRGGIVYRGSVNSVTLVRIIGEAALGANGVLCLKCVRKWKKFNA